MVKINLYSFCYILKCDVTHARGKLGEKEGEAMQQNALSILAAFVVETSRTF